MKCTECKEPLKQIRDNTYYCISSITNCSLSTKTVHIS